MLGVIKNRLRSALPRPPAPSATSPTGSSFAAWLASAFQATRFIGSYELRSLEDNFRALPNEADRLAAAKAISDYFSAHSDKARLLCGSEHYLRPHLDGVAARLAYIAGNFVLGNSRHTLRQAERLAVDWPNPLTSIILARVRGDAVGPAAEHDDLVAALARYPDDTVLKYNLIENLIGTDRVEEANEAMEAMRAEIEDGLADEIAIVKTNQAILEKAIKRGAYAPEGDEDIYSDQKCRDYWISYYESYVTRLPRQHGDRLLLETFVRWVRRVQWDVDVVLDFGSLCAQPLFEAALAAPHVQFVGADRQEFIAAMNRAAYPLPNMAFEHGDIFDVMERVSKLPGRKALTHVRTTCTLYPRMVEELYRASARLGFAHVYLIENAGLVRSRLRFMRYTAMQEPALVTKHRLNLHNYREFLSRPGYSLREFSRIRGPGLWRGDHATNYLGSQYEIHAALDG